ncbi:EAL and HDOD domain-containing protein [Desulfogranum japonicum]|uniref:EAL and HDOD domain-containing protein n=1 Tax=Desulfogranum japonicum TaxID=231447 RepID=UPI00041A8FA2|nr:EAL domain-containing protein [Desulfogranum japonicum]
MDQFIARQPIFTAYLKVHAYELLYRGKGNYSLGNVTGDRATTSLLSSTFLTKDIKDISSFKPCYINFTQELLEKRLPLSFPSTTVVVEILESVQPTEKVISCCKLLKEAGYTLALDDFVYDRRLIPLLELVDVVKIDFRLTPLDAIHRTLHHLARYKVKLLAEKVETQHEFESANKLGFTLFQGFFFSKPEQIKIKELTANKITHMNLLAEVARKNTTIDRLHQIIGNDVSVTYKLLKFLNSSYFYRLQEIKNLKHAIAYLGQKELRNFLMLVIISEMATEKPGELIRLGLVRAKFCELLAPEEDESIDSSELFLVGLFSLLDVMLDQPIDKLFNSLPLNKTVKDAIILGLGPYADYLELAKSYEQQRESRFLPILERLQVSNEMVNQSYMTALRYANGLIL